MKRWFELLEEDRLKRLGKLPFSEARLATSVFLSEVAESLPPAVRELLSEIRDVAHCRVSQSLVDKLDTLYFDLEDAGDLIRSGQAFSAARFASACLFFRNAASVDDLMHAVYEGQHARAPNGD